MKIIISMRTIPNIFNKLALALALSITAMPDIVNGQGQSLTSVNQDGASSKSDLKDSVKDTRDGVAKLIAITLKSGTDSDISNVLASVIGLPGAMPMKKQEVVIGQSDTNVEKRACYVIYENTASTAPESDEKRAVCAYIVKIKRTGLDKQTRYFRIDLNGKLEKVVLSEGKYDASGHGVRGSGVKTDQDIDSPEVRKTFEAEMRFWLKDWLKKELKNAAKTADAAKPPAAPAL
ncbi:MAG: hypothetical protein ABL955_02335 [Elusimicrobiota bacterium]